MVDIIVKTVRGLERIAASRVLEALPGSSATPRPYGFVGLVLVEVPGDRWVAADVILREVCEAEKVLVVEAEARADPAEIAERAAEVAKRRISSSETFAVRTTRRGTHPFTSIDVNVIVGARVREATGADVNLDFPDKIVWVEILHDRAYVSVTSGEVEHKKVYEGKPSALPVLRRIAIAQVPYTGPLDAVEKMGVRIGRSVQTFELAELYVTPFKPVSGEELEAFIRGLLEGIRSRYEIQRRTYSRKVHRVPVYVQDLYQFVRDRRGEPMIATSTRGRVVSELKEEIADLFRRGRRVNVLVGAREGLPTGVFRYSSLTVDLAPSVTISTDFACTAAVIALVTVLEESGLMPRRGRGGRVTQA